MTGLFLFSVIAFAQSRRVTGVVYGESETGTDVLIGANIVEKGTTNGTISDLDGKFSLKVNSDAILVISFVGFETQEIPTKGESTFNIRLKEYHQMLDEAIIIAHRDDDD